MPGHLRGDVAGLGLVGRDLEGGPLLIEVQDHAERGDFEAGYGVAPFWTRVDLDSS